MRKEIVLDVRWAAVDRDGKVWLYTHKPILHETPDGWYWDTTPDGDDYGIPFGEYELGDWSPEAPLVKLPNIFRLTVWVSDAEGEYLQ